MHNLILCFRALGVTKRTRRFAWGAIYLLTDKGERRGWIEFILVSLSQAEKVLVFSFSGLNIIIKCLSF